MMFQARTTLAALFTIVVCIGCTNDPIDVGSDESDADTAAGEFDGTAADTSDASPPTDARETGGRDAPCRTYPAVDPESTMVAGRLHDGVAVDGRLDEGAYESLPTLEVADAQGETDNRMRVRVGWTAEELYLGIIVEDAEVSFDEQRMLYKNDGVEVFVDTERDGGSDLRADDHQWLVSATGETHTKRGSGGDDEPETSIGLEVETNVGDEAYIVEMGVPLDGLDLDPSPGDAVGFLVANNDRQAGEHVSFAWRDVDPFKQPGEWGTLVFADPNCGGDVGPPRDTNRSTADAGTDAADGDDGKDGDAVDTSCADDDPGIRHCAYDGPLGGGEGMPADMVVSESEADRVVSSMDELQSAVDAASSGEVIYVSGQISGHLTVNTPGVTIAGNRGVGDDGRWTDASLAQNAANLTLSGLSIDGGGGGFCEVNATGLTVFNCLVENVSDGDGAFGWNVGDTAATFSHSTFRDWSYYGLQVRYNWHDRDHKITIQYSDLHDLGQHMIQGGYGWFHLRDNHFHGSLNTGNDHILEVRGGNDAPVSCGVDAGNAIVEHNLNEARGDEGASGLVRVRGVPTEGVWVRHNRAPLTSAATGGCHERNTHGYWRNQIVMQNASDTDSLKNVHLQNNVIDQ